MSALLIVVGFCLLILPGIARPISLRIDPRRWTTLCIIAFVTGLALIEIGLLALSATAFVANNHSGCTSNCVIMMTNAAPGGVFLGWVLFSKQCVDLARGQWICIVPQDFHHSSLKLTHSQLYHALVLTLFS